MLKKFNLSVLLAISLLTAVNANAEEKKFYLADVYTEAELNSDVFGVPMRIDNVGDSQFLARYYNQKANTPVYILGNKTDFSEVYGDGGNGTLSWGSSLKDVKPIMLETADAYYAISFDIDANSLSVNTYEVEDYMDPVMWPIHTSENPSYHLNHWFTWVDTGTDDWVPTDDAWMREFYFGYSSGPEHVTTFIQDAKNKHRYYLSEPLHLTAGDKMEFIIHNYHESGWWNYCTWRVENEEECEIFKYYGAVVKQAYLDWVYGEGKADWTQWKDGDYRNKFVSDTWCKPIVPAEGDYNFEFDSHLGRAKLVPVATEESDINSLESIRVDALEGTCYDIFGRRLEAPATRGVYIINGKKVLK